MMFAPALPAVPRRGGVTVRVLRSATIGLAFACQLPLFGCTGSAEASDAARGGSAPKGRSATAAPVVALSDYENATYTTLAVDGAGAIHAAWVDRVPGRTGPRLLYRVSRDGRAWSAIADLSEGQPAGFTGIPRLVADRAGRVYAVWKVINPGGTLVFDEEKPDSPAYGTLIYRVLEAGRWSAVGALGSPQGVLSWYTSVDPVGRAHVVWSETPDEFSTFTMPSSATLVRHTMLDGTRTATREVVRGAGAGGYTGLNGYVDAEGTPHWIAVRADDASSRYTLVHWGGAAERAIWDFAPLRTGYEGHTLPQLVVDAAGREHVILYNGVRNGPGILDLAPGQRQPQGVTYQPRNGGGSRIENFQVSGGPGGKIVTTVQVKGEPSGTLTNLFASEFDGATWSAPVQLTNNAAGGSESGVVDAAGRSLGNTKAWYAVHASVAYDQSGAPMVLMTNRETSSTLDVRPGGSASALGRSRVFFARPAGLTNAGTVARAPAPAPAPVTGGDHRDVPRPGTTDAKTPPRAGTSNSASVEERFARYDITESGTLSGTELDACRCRQHDANRDGQVSRAEYVAGEVLAESGLPPLGSTNARAPDRGATAPARASGSVARGKYTCYSQGTRQPMPWEPGYGNIAPAPIATTKYLFYLTIENGSDYQYLNRGRGTYRADDAGTITWLSGPFSGSGIKAAVKPSADGRSVMYLELGGTRAACVGPAS